jgi:RimJ/RimL family protein N-acetyltransferase
MFKLINGDTITEGMISTLYKDTFMKPGYEAVHGQIFSPINWNEDDCEFYMVGDSEHNIDGFIKLKFNRVCNTCTISIAVSFSDNKGTMYTALKHLIPMIFSRNISHVNWFCFSGISHNKGYEKIVKKYGGKIEGVLRYSFVTWDGIMRDAIMYGISQNEYSTSIAK